MRRVLTIAMLMIATCGAARGQQQPIVRAEVTPESVIVGEPAELTITVLVPTWFTRPPVYPAFELANAMTRLPSNSSYSIRERVGNESWSGIVRTYEIYPLLGASYRMGGQRMTITFANPGSDPISVETDVPEVVLRGIVPEGAESLEPYLAGRSLALGIDIEGNLDELKVGDAIVLTYHAELDGLSAIFLPPLAPELEFEGVNAYRDIPEVQDGVTARRSEKVTLVFDAGGEFNIPGMELRFWNTATQAIMTSSADGVVVSVKGPPATPAPNEKLEDARWQWFAGTAVGAITLLVILWRGIPVLKRRLREVRERRRQTEEYAFKQLLRALGAGDSAVAYRALLHWAERLEPGISARTLAARYGDPPLSAAVASLSARNYGDTKRPCDLALLKRELVSARKRYRESATVRRESRLPPLNP